LRQGVEVGKKDQVLWSIDVERRPRRWVPDLWLKSRGAHCS
jgi:hypothetical protein